MGTKGPYCSRRSFCLPWVMKLKSPPSFLPSTASAAGESRPTAFSPAREYTPPLPTKLRSISFFFFGSEKNGSHARVRLAATLSSMCIDETGWRLR